MKSKSPFLRKSPLKIAIGANTYGQAPGSETKSGPAVPTYTPRPSTGTNAFVGETLSQQRTSEQMRASNEALMAAGGTRGIASDAGYSSQVNAVTGLSPDAFAGDEILPSTEGMGAVIASGDGPANNALIE